MGGGTQSKLLEPSSQISTNFQCNNCHVTLDQKGLTEPITKEDITPISIVEAEAWTNKDLDARTETEFERIMSQQIIESDYEMSIVMDMLKKKEKLSTSDEAQPSNINSMISEYHTQAYNTNIHILSLDGGGIRGYMPIKILYQLITETYLTDIKNFDPEKEEHMKRFIEGQEKLIDQFDYIAGTSTGGLIAFCLAINHNVLNLEKIYKRSSFYFKRNRLGPYLWDKYDPINIHNQIDEIINKIKWPYDNDKNKQITAENATLLDVHKLLNPKHMITDDMLANDKLGKTLMSHDNWLEFFDPSSLKNSHQNNQSKIRSFVERVKVLLITAYNTTGDTITVFNTSYAKHWPYRIADVLKATMAAPTYFPPKHIHKRIIKDGRFVEDPNANKKTDEIFIDGGVFTNDPELVAIWAIRMQWKKLVNYHLLLIGTGCYNAKLSPSTWSGYPGWIRTDGLAINILMDVTRSSTEIMTNNLAKFNNIRRMKFNYRLLQSMGLDDPEFIKNFDKEWETLKTGDDFKALMYFYMKYINKTKI